MKSLAPDFHRQRQAVQIGARLAPAGRTKIEDADKLVVVGGLQQVGHLVHDHVFEQVARLLDQFRVHANT